MRGWRSETAGLRRREPSWAFDGPRNTVTMRPMWRRRTPVAFLLGTQLLTASCLPVSQLYQPGRIEPKLPPNILRKHPLAVYVSRIDTHRLTTVPLRGARTSSVDARLLGPSLRHHLQTAMAEISLFSRVLPPTSRRGASYVEVSGRMTAFELEASPKPTRSRAARTVTASGTMELMVSIWPGAVVILKEKVQVQGRASGILPIHPAIDALTARMASKIIDRLATSESLATAVDRVVESRSARVTAETPPAPARPVVAIFDLQGANNRFEVKDLAALTSYIGAKMAESGRFEVVPRQDVVTALRRQKELTYKDCFAESCQIEIGAELAAEKTLSGSIVEFADQCIVTLRLYDLKKSTQESAGTAKADCSAASVLGAIDSAMAKLAR